MQVVIILALSTHVLASVFWAGTTFALVRTRGAGAERLFAPQMGAAALAVLTGGYLGHLLHSSAFGRMELTLAIGAASALAAVAIQAVVAGRAIRKLRGGWEDGDAQARSAIVVANRFAAALLAVTTISMASARYA